MKTDPLLGPSLEPDLLQASTKPGVSDRLDSGVSPSARHHPSTGTSPAPSRGPSWLCPSQHKPTALYSFVTSTLDLLWAQPISRGENEEWTSHPAGIGPIKRI
ncbi:hypothetical protein V6N13_125384 [Hibiscus sabdariffa]|uniref:Uncharacterized protein n=1 Tax=Hibiscus sabdariffa TaxID=183260 RepID=A0ABR2U5P7_9ROSI